jgi:hypothetical protein
MPGSAVQVKASKLSRKRTRSQRLELSYVKLLSSFASKFSLRRYRPDLRDDQGHSSNAALRLPRHVARPGGGPQLRL